MAKNKKAISPVVATSLLIVVAVVAIVGFQNWYQGYQTILQSDVNVKSSGASKGIKVETIFGSTLYVNNQGTSNQTFDSLKINGIDCSINQNVSPGVTPIDISACLNSSGNNEVVIVTSTGVIKETIYLEEVNVSLPATNYFVSVWNTSKTCGSCSAGNTIVLPLEATGTYNFTIHWGDGSSENVIGTSGFPISHTYASSGVYTINIDGEIIGFRFNNGGDISKIIDIQKWGPLRVGNNGHYFYGCDNLKISASDSINLSNTDNLEYMFAMATSLTNENFNSWNVSGVINMNSLFYGANNFNGNINLWDVSSVTNMYQMFGYASKFNSSLSLWNVSNVLNMQYLFVGASDFNQDLSIWDVSNVINARGIFYDASDFNQDLSIWNVSSATNMIELFRNAVNFNQDLSSWVVDQVTSCSLVYSNTPAWALPKPNFTACTP